MEGIWDQETETVGRQPQEGLQSRSGPASVVPRCGPSRWRVGPPGPRPVVPAPPQASAPAAPTPPPFPLLCAGGPSLTVPHNTAPPSPRKASTFSLSEIEALSR